MISYSIGTDQNELIAAWEKSTPLFEQRMQAIHTLSPLGYWRDLSGTLSQFKTWGVAYLTTLFLKKGIPSANTPARFLTYVRAYYPTLLDPAWHAEQIQMM